MLTKSNYISGIKCPKRMMLEIQNPITEDEISFEILENARELEKLVQHKFPNVLLVEKGSNCEEDIKNTEKAIQTGAKYIAEATFKKGEMMCRVDILENTKNGFNIYEIKSSGTEKQEYIYDLAYQFYILKSQLKMNKAFLIQPKKYHRHSKLDPNRLIKIKNKTTEVINEQPKIRKKAPMLLKIIQEGQIPNVEISKDCRCNSLDCPYFRKSCLKGIRPASIFDKSGLSFEKKINAYNKGIIYNEDILKDKVLAAGIKPAELKNEKTINKPEIKKFLDTIKYPISYLDFETISYLIPKYENHTSNAKIIIQYSLHIKNEGESLIHKFMLEKPDKDPRRALALGLIKDVPKEGSVIVYHKAFESSVIKGLADLYPDLKDQLLAIDKRLIDLETVFKNKHYYDPAFLGSSSIKVVLPALYPNDEDLNYKKFTHVHNGLEAASWLRKEDYNDEIRNDLLAYCELDTLAMVKIHDKLKDLF